VIRMDEAPAQAVRRKRDASMNVCARLCRTGDADGWVSAGNSAGVLLAAVLLQGRLPGVDRPALGAVLPTMDGGSTYLLDVGVSVDCPPRLLVQFAHLGAAYSRAVLLRAEPRVALLSNGAEPGKGSSAVRMAHELLRRSPLHFVGNVESNDLFSGKADVIVADGFVANAVVKAAEATAQYVSLALRREIPRTLAGRVAGLLLQGQLRAVRGRTDWRHHGGAPLIGIDGVAVVAHGRSDADAIANAVRVAKAAVEMRLVENVRNAHSRDQSATVAEPACLVGFD
jgi:phosphate acyltransferase